MGSIGQVEKAAVDTRPAYDPKCYLCPGNQRVGGHANPRYTSTFVFPNDFPAVQAEQPVLEPNERSETTAETRLLRAESTRGDCQVICFHPQHNLTIAQMTTEEILPVVDAWTGVYRTYRDQHPHIRYVVIFENKGEMMGCSNPHPHGQVWATEQIPEEPALELEGLLEYQQQSGHHQQHPCLLCDYAKLEVDKRERVVCGNDSFVAVVPWWAVWPYEVLVVARPHLRSLLDFHDEHRRDLADILRRVACRYDNLFQCSFPYSMGIHQAPCIPADRASPLELREWEASHFHLHFYPPLLRSATVKKFLVGFELLGTPQRDLTSEQAAAKLQAMSEVHYSTQTAARSE